MNFNLKLCECGLPTKIAKQTDKRYGHIVGFPIRFVSGHNIAWKGGKSISTDGYNTTYIRGDRSYRTARIVAARVLKKPLPKGAVVHRIDENRLNDANSNLLICENTGYHLSLHRRLRALKSLQKLKKARMPKLKKVNIFHLSTLFGLVEVKLCFLTQNKVGLEC